MRSVNALLSVHCGLAVSGPVLLGLGRWSWRAQRIAGEVEKSSPVALLSLVLKNGMLLRHRVVYTGEEISTLTRKSASRQATWFVLVHKRDQKRACAG